MSASTATLSLADLIAPGTAADAGARRTPGFRLHVYTALAGLFIINLLSLSLAGMNTVFAASGVVLAALAALRSPKLWLGAAAFLGTMAALFLLEPVRLGPWAAASSAGYWFLRMGVSALAAVYVILTVTPSDFIAGLHRARVPRFVSVPATVMLRFLPQARREFQAVTEAMTLRGIPLGAGDWFRHPLRTVEYVVVPLLVSCSRLADDLTASGLVRGLGGPAQPTPLIERSLTWRDAVGAIVLVGLLVGALWPGSPLR